VDTDYLVECVLEIARRYRQLEEENESYRQRKEVFANLYEKEKGEVVKYSIEFEQLKKLLGKLKENLKREQDQKTQQALKIRKLDTECTRLRTVLQHSTEEWNREKQNLLQIKNEKLKQTEMQERNEVERIPGELQKLRDELQVARLDKEQVTKEFEMRISDLLVEQTQKEQEILKLKNQLAATDAANIITLRKENNNLRNAVRYLEKTKVEKDNENAAVLLQLREYQRKYGAFGSTYAYDYPVGQGVTVADGGKRTSVPSDKQ
jgi:chromosome segregation ATPase